MKIKKITATNIPPIKNFIADDLKDLVVIAGPNGVGKTRLVEAMLRCFQTSESDNPKEFLTNPSFIIEATDSLEFEEWKQEELDTTNPEDAAVLRNCLLQRRKRRDFRNGVLYYDNNRWMRDEDLYSTFPSRVDPWEDSIPENLTLGGLGNRWEDTEAAIFKKMEYEGITFGHRALQLWQEGHDSMSLDFEEFMAPFNDAFSNLFGPKTLVKPDIHDKQLMYMDGEQQLGIWTLSSGELEVLRIVFDFVLRKPSHCIVFFDEPELHLHSGLLTRMIRTLQSIGESNQFIIATHSTKLISFAQYETVVFLTPPKDDNSNQAATDMSIGEVTEVLGEIGLPLDIVSYGKKFVLIEGTETSLDMKTYGRIVEDKFPTLTLLPCGNKNTLSSFDSNVSPVLQQTFPGLEFFMLADRDTVGSVRSGATKHFSVLSRYELENFYFDAEILRQCFAEIADGNSWLQSAERIDQTLGEIAQSQMNDSVRIIVASQIRREVGRVNLKPGDIQNMDFTTLLNAFSTKAEEEKERIQNTLDNTYLRKLVKDTYDRLGQLLKSTDGAWKREFPGKPILSKFCAKTPLKQRNLTTLYINNSQKANPNPFQEIINIFSSFANR